MKLYQLFLAFTLTFFGLQTYAQTGTIRGFIYDQSNGEPMPFQKIKATSKSNLIYGAITDVNGFFSIPKLALGEFTIQCM